MPSDYTTQACVQLEFAKLPVGSSRKQSFYSQETIGSLQVCASQIAGMKAAIHPMHSTFQNNDTEAILLVDAFTSLNRQAALLNIRYLCPLLAPTLIDSYREATELFIDGQVPLSEEGTTQGDPLAMPMYALATIPFIIILSGCQQYQTSLVCS